MTTAVIVLSSIIGGIIIGAVVVAYAFIGAITDGFKTLFGGG